MLPNFFFISILSSLIFIPSHSQCLDDQKSSLLELKNELIFNSSISTKLVQWNQTYECCQWYGVECDGAGHIISLQLDDESISGGIGDSSSLFRLKYLEKLNLAYNDFNSTHIPRGIQNLTYLTHLNLSRASFGGQVPAEISSLRRLISLDISNDEIQSKLILEHPNLEMLVQNLTVLRELYLDGFDMSSTGENGNWSYIISSYLPNITALSLCDCTLSGPFARPFWQLHSLSILRLDGNDLSTIRLDWFANFSSLITLSLYDCQLKGSLPNNIFHLPTLQDLDLSENNVLSGNIPPFTQKGSLKSIKLSSTNISGSIPSSISNLKTLSYIDLANCKLTGTIPLTFANLTTLTYVFLGRNFFTGRLSSTLFEGLFNLVLLSLEENSFSGNIPHSLFHLSTLEGLYLGDNKFNGLVQGVPIVNISNMVTLDLSFNRLEGPIPNSFFQLRRLESLLLSTNLFNGSIQLDNIIQSLLNLTYLDLSGNNLSVHVSDDNSSTYNLPMLEILRLSECNMHGFPDFIKHSDLMRILDLSNNRIGGEIPSWIWGARLEELNLSLNLLTSLQKPYHVVPSSLYLLDLRSNQLRGDLNLPFLPTYMSLILLLSHNSFSGSIPTSLCNIPNLDALVLSFNKLSGNIPSCLFKNLRALDLMQNNISGHIPDSFPLHCKLQYFNLKNNTLQGKIPKSLESCKRLKVMNVGNNIINDTFPCMLPSSLRVLVLHSNRFHGEVKCRQNKRWPVLQIIDISLNNFSGSLQSVNFSSWRGMVLDNDDARLRNDYYSLEESGMTLIMKGLDSELQKIWHDFSSVDFSCNSFEGELPNGIGDLSSLRLLNLSHTGLNGSIPKSFGQLRNLESLDLSRNQLTGPIPLELSRLTFLSVLNLSYNELIGEIPKGRQLQTFSVDSFLGNPGLCSFNLNISCIVHSEDESDENEGEKKKKKKKKKKTKREIEWEYVSAALRYVVGLGSFVWFLLFYRSFRHKYFGKIDEVVEEIFDAKDKSRRRLARRRALRNRVRRH